MGVCKFFIELRSVLCGIKEVLTMFPYLNPSSVGFQPGKEPNSAVAIFLKSYNSNHLANHIPIFISF